MSMALWQEIDKLRLQVSQLETKISEQSATLENLPQLRIGDVIKTEVLEGNRVFAVQERTATETKEEVYINVRVVPGDLGPGNNKLPVIFYSDKTGKKYILPNPHRFLLIQDQGGNTGKRVEKDSSGSLSVPEESETLDMIIAEPASNFHDDTPATKTGRIYPGQYLISLDGETKFYLIFLAGHGDADKNHDVDLGTGNSLRITTDYAGKFVSMELV